MSRPFPFRPFSSSRSATATGLVILALLSACTTAKSPEQPVQTPVVAVPPPPAVVPTDIVLGPADEQALKSAMDKLSGMQPNTPLAWSNPDSGLTGAVKVLRDGYDERNRPCREFHSVIHRENLYKHSTGFICREADGKWMVVDLREYPTYRHGGA